jgi:hypothetical protein
MLADACRYNKDVLKQDGVVSNMQGDIKSFTDPRYSDKVKKVYNFTASIIVIYRKIFTFTFIKNSPFLSNPVDA